MAKKIYTCQVIFPGKTAYYKKVENPQLLADYLDKKSDWKYLNVFEVDKTKDNRCGLYTGLRIYSVNQKKV
ncbi:hypothetical protein [Chryseobacterium sp. 18068]|uniref:hypothetical protein n=1 Tax=Chryseobacterium sp. 18068 TaxID=2681414 RepID=UPI00135B3270|nr:hypothetical protein [Chryseobacterium sp. 18068]